MEENYIEILNEMDSIRPSNFEKIGILLAVNPDDDRKGDPYFKMYDSTSFYTAKTVWRINFLKPELIKKHLGKIPSGTRLGRQEKEKLIEYLNMSSRDFPQYTVWDELKYRWNLEKNLINQFGFLDYVSGAADKYYQNRENTEYLPFSLEQPDYRSI